MEKTVISSEYFGFALSVGAYIAGLALRKRFNCALVNPLLAAVIIVMCTLHFTGVSYAAYNGSAAYLSYFLTPATVCLAIPLYRQMGLLKKYCAAVCCGIFAGVAASAASILVMSRMMRLGHTVYVTLLPKSITTAIGMGVSAEAGGMVTVTVISIILTGIIGNIIAEPALRLLGITDPIAKGLAIGTSSHAIGTVRALEMGEVEGATSSLAVAAAGLITVLAVPLAAALY